MTSNHIHSDILSTCPSLCEYVINLLCISISCNQRSETQILNIPNQFTTRFVLSCLLVRMVSVNYLIIDIN